MNEEDLRDCFAMFALAGYVMRGEIPHKDIAYRAYNLADIALEARNKPKESDDEEDVGIARVAPKRNYRRKS
jgi:negative regulator of sigma E activity